ncbi:MAG: hypothetical protein B6U87_01740 [Candidatus Aenigmarchaeota archaeon ex4484_52]|nr:MAG: hypothetical protein B6U87_01740 [Candidatus Aenigmarchaeota archaeon ex4484_52]
MKEKDIIEIDYIAKIKNTGDVFDLTNEQKAKKLNIYNKNYLYHPVIIILGQGFILKALEDRLLKINEKNIGKTFTFVFEPKEAFGERNNKLVKTISTSYLNKKNISPKIGERIEFEDEKNKKLIGKVISISSGRVCIDFNNALAGKTVEYEVSVNKIFKTQEERINAIIKMFIPTNFKEVETKIKQNAITISLPKKLDNAVIKQLIAKYINLCIDKIKEIKFYEKY